MPPKDAKQEKKAKVAEDKTFGLKNKNKSKTVQKYIKQINMTVTGESSKKDREERKEKAEEKKSGQKSALMNSLFNLQTDKKGKAYDPVAKKKQKEAEEEAIAAGMRLKEAVKKEIIEGIANTIQMTNPKTGVRMSELGGHPIIQTLKDKHINAFKIMQLLLFIKALDKVFWCDDRESSNPMIRCQEDVDKETGPDDRKLEEIVEERRKALTGVGTPINAETFAAWKLKKEKERIEKVEEDRKALAKKTGGKGLAAMSGRDLFTYDATLFVDDEGAASGNEYEEREDGMPSDSEGDAAADEDSDDDDEPDKESKPEGDARGSGEAPAVAINKDIFLQEGDDDLDDLDDLDDDDEEEDEGATKIIW